MQDLSVIILTYNEELHLERCIKNIQYLARDVFVVDSYSTDRTVQIAKDMGAIVYQNKWENSQAKQFNWALTHLPIKTKWVLRLDADEYLTSALSAELIWRLAKVPDEVTGIIFKRRHIFLGKWMKRGTYPVKLLRLFQYGKATCEQRWMDEHIQLTEGKTMEFENDFVDHNLNDLTWWTQKHNSYAIREAIDLLDIELNLTGRAAQNELTSQAAAKRAKKLSYAKKPLFFRSFAYFIYRYILKLGFTEGKQGFLWHFLQGWWYRTLVDAKLFEIKQACGTDTYKIIEYIQTHHQIDCRNL
ncbi:MAG: glycosyltransferase family 2 protein [Dysgonamonadaceae bacterium]|jgi:glycosyltransferase involved in cell wall biosynthesis|nr:glycosyltransferase family 2 protein [Dysgonamonadaceae bacterium]